MPELTELKNYMPCLESDDIFKTSYGVGHHWRPGYYFPDTETLAKCSSGETCSLTPGNEIKPVEHFQTTTGSTYDAKIIPEVLKVDRLPLPPHHWDTLYINDFRSRYLAGHYHRPLSPSHQKSETHDAFKRSEGPTELWRPLSLQPFVLESHHKDGPSKRIIASNANPDLAGRSIYPKDNEILRNLDPYLSTSMKEHRIWTPEELSGFAKKDIATYWDLEDYPKAKGFGLQKNPIPKDSVPRQRPPMRENLVFREATDHTRVRPLTYHVPHTGLKTLYQSDFEQPASLLRTQDQICPVETPFVLPDPDKKSTFATPLMYQTEYSTIGQCQRNLL
ncbi:uncharacterized protein DEA37_0005518 [Paragonimus westermani]|uniref:Uncharacterized protein n=1 Tax=Paragonimus westermani TaxID=34504 RepID=A0A5J4NW80_9TREM|nr:uncharacterized protein DEA37_0005518 [Paragonimus westermani]